MYMTKLQDAKRYAKKHPMASPEEIAQATNCHVGFIHKLGLGFDRRFSRIPGHYSTEDNACKHAFRTVYGYDPFHDERP